VKYQFAMDSIAAVYGSTSAVRRAKNEPPGAGNDHRSRFKSRICAGTALQRQYRMTLPRISMMAGSTCSNQRPDTLMQDRISQDRRKPLAPHGRTIHKGQTVSVPACPTYALRSGRAAVAHFPACRRCKHQPGHGGARAQSRSCNAAVQWDRINSNKGTSGPAGD
jgi:hypothetical protein